MGKKGELMYDVILHVILLALVLGLFLMGTVGRAESREVKQEILEKQTALLIDSADSGMSFILSKKNRHGEINGVRVDGRRVYVDVEGLKSINGYRHFSNWDIEVEETKEEFIIRVK